MVTLLTRSAFVILSLSLVPYAAFGDDSSRRVPTIDDLLKIESLSGARISPDGKRVAYGMSHADFKQDAFVSHLWLADVATGKAVQLTRGEKSAGNPIWSPDGRWLAFTSDRAGGKSQVFVISPDGGEAV